MTDTATKISELLQEAADDDWASWYADWLVRLSELPELLGVMPVRSELVYMLVRLVKEYAEQQRSEPWQQYYAVGLVEHFTGS